MCFGIFRRGLGRPPTLPGAVGNASQLAITTQPSSSAQNNVNFALTPVIQLQDAQGVNVALAGIEIIITTVIGPGTTTESFPTTPGPNGGALTDATGAATYTAIKMRGITGSRRIEFGTPGDTYTRVISNPISLVAGAASAPDSTATVPSGRVGQVTTIIIQVRDISENALTTGGNTVLVTVSGANNVGPAIATDLGNGSYQFTYTPSVAGTDMVTITLDGLAIGNSPTTSVVSPAVVADSPRLRIGLFNLAIADIGKGPGGGTTDPIYGATVLVVSPSTISALIDAADAADVLVFANFAGSRQSWCDPVPNSNFLTYSPTKYQAQINRFSEASLGTITYTKLVDALTRRRLVPYPVDEPFHNQFNGSITKADVNQMCRWHKDLFGRVAAMTCVRVCAGRTDNIQAMNPPPPGGWPDVDFCWLQYEGPLHQPRYPVTTTQTALAFYQNQIALAASIGLRVILGLNWLDGGSAACWNYQLTGSSGRIVGTFVQTGSAFTPGQSITCGTAVGTQSRWFSPPSEVTAVINAIMSDPVVQAASPALMLWSHSPRGADADSIFVPLELRADNISVLDGLITTGDTRTSWIGWGTPK